MSEEDLRGPNASLVGRPGSRTALGTPALVLDLDRLDANIRSMAKHAELRGYQVRPCAKIHKSVEIARRQIAAGAVGICSATLAEAETMVAGGIPGVMLFTSVVSEPKLQRLVALNTRAEGLMVVVDDLNNVDQLGFLSRQCGHALQVLVDLELGGGRTGLSDVALAIALARRIQETEGLEFVGIQAYNGLGLSDPDYDARRSVLLRRLRELSEMVAGSTMRVSILPSCPVAAREVTTLTPKQGYSLRYRSEPTYSWMDITWIPPCVETTRILSNRR